MIPYFQGTHSQEQGHKTAQELSQSLVYPSASKMRSVGENSLFRYKIIASHHDLSKHLGYTLDMQTKNVAILFIEKKISFLPWLCTQQN